MRLPDFEAWAMFAAVVEHRSFTDAAKALSVSKATVSKAVTRLEEHLDTSLFNRTSRRLALTESGKRLADHAQRILAEGRAAEEAARDETAELSGVVRLGAPMTFGLLRIAPLVAQFTKMHPLVDIELHLSDAKIDIVEMGLDATIRIADMPDSSLRARRLAEVASLLSDSGIETHFLHLMHGIGVTVAQQVWVDGHPLDGLIGDRLAIQLDGFAHHQASDRRRDLRADARLALRGFTVLRFDYHQVLFEPDYVTATVTDAVAQGLHRQPLASRRWAFSRR